MTSSVIRTAAAGSAASWRLRELAAAHPADWPPLPRTLCACAAAVAVVMAGQIGYLGARMTQLQAASLDEQRLRAAYLGKSSQASLLLPLRAQKRQLERHVALLQQQLPGKAEMAALLTDINQAGAARGLQFDLFKPSQVLLREHYAELPITLRVSGAYHDLGAFAGDLAGLPRIVTLGNLTISTGRDGMLTLDAVAKTFRYLDPEELRSQRRLATDKKKPLSKS